MMLLVSYSLSIPEELKDILASSAELAEKESAIREFLDEESQQFSKFLDAYRLLSRGVIVDGSLTVDHIGLEGVQGVVYMSFDEQEHLGCRDMIQTEEHMEEVHFHSQRRWMTSFWSFTTPMTRRGRNDEGIACRLSGDRHDVESSDACSIASSTSIRWRICRERLYGVVQSLRLTIPTNFSSNWTFVEGQLSLTSCGVLATTLPEPSHRPGHGSIQCCRHHQRLTKMVWRMLFL
jgi:hypothetical protein